MADGLENKLRFGLNVINLAFEFSINFLSLFSIGSEQRNFVTASNANA
jgi:hypothetical protein